MLSFSAAVLGLSLLASAGAQATIDVTVGGPNGETFYSPPSVVASPGDHVIFHFNPKNHSVTQSSFNDPCSPSYGGFDSGFHPVPIGTTYGNPTFEFIVKDNSPVWVYCRQAENTAGSHCGKGMVFAINPGFPGSSNTFAAFQTKALAIGAALSASAGLSTTAAATTATSTYTASSGSPTIHVTVGGPNGETVYNPTNVVASPGDHVLFHFNPKNHSVTQSSFNDPCTNLYGGFDSGFHPVPIGQTYGNPTFEVIVKDNNPIWVHCRQAENTAGSHCGKGMVFAVNPGFPGSSNTFAAFQAKALAIGAALSSSAGLSVTTTAAYGSATPQVVTITKTVTVEADAWTTTYAPYPSKTA
ncbi:hypothetical protein FA95DRAFT_1675775 [Auriscalpium vulgare]|uniref:Uncharacterized protein n=1 Tax=Auriscalpium vulgare TaxID=40419 RepID=A0ACB8S5I6_9AGAM|nr:hypothetical protein FA95DRAFT_1675775 [Auriscalpium vulgare]